MNRARITLTSIVATVLVLTACGGGSEGDDVSADVTTSMTAPKETTAPTPSTTRPPTTSEASTTVTEAAAAWREKVTAACDGAGPLLDAIQPNNGTAASIAAEAVATKAVFQAAPWASIVFPADVQPTADRIATMSDEAIAHLDTSIGLAGAGDTEGAGSLGGELTQYDLETLEPIRTFGGSRGLLFAGAGTADGSLFAMSGGDRLAAIYDVASGVQLGGPITIATDERSAVRLSIDGRWLAVGGQPTAVDDVVDDGRGELRAAQMWDLDPASWIRAACNIAGRDLTRDEWTTHIGELAPYRSTCPD